MRIVHFPDFNLHAFIDEMDRAQGFAQIRGVMNGARQAKRLGITFGSPSFDGEVLELDSVGYINLLCMLNSEHNEDPASVRLRLEEILEGERWEEMALAVIQATLPELSHGEGETARIRELAKAQMSDAELDGWRLDSPAWSITEKPDED